MKSLDSTFDWTDWFAKVDTCAGGLLKFTPVVHFSYTGELWQLYYKYLRAYIKMEQFIGTWALKNSDNFDEYMKAVGKISSLPFLIIIF